MFVKLSEFTVMYRNEPKAVLSARVAQLTFKQGVVGLIHALGKWLLWPVYKRRSQQDLHRSVMDLLQVLCSNPASTGISYGYLVSDICLQYQAVYMSKKFEDKFQPGANEWVAHWVHCGVNSIKNSLSKKCFFLCATETCMS